jgi:hypothetical protein
MIPVKPVKHPPNRDLFKSKVADPGHAWLASLASPPNSKAFKGRNYWKHCLPDLYEVYGRICAYSCLWIPPDLEAASVDHYLAKTKAPKLAYTWSNYRLATRPMNRNKSDKLGVLDPFKVKAGWFALNFGTLEVIVGPTAPDSAQQGVLDSIDILKLNGAKYRRGREQWFQLWCTGRLSIEGLKQVAPFIAAEIVRQNYQRPPA